MNNRSFLFGVFNGVETGKSGLRIPVQVPRVRDRGVNEVGSKIKFRSALVPPYLLKAKSVEEPLPLLYLKGINRVYGRSACKQMKT